ncbi:MAG: hypothetical protein E6K53_11040 [Gammaproteobacteria bacterium]|nr:MAG: hypothetical protein E6K53_11040 [Gammaproteobacteria bacterium]
MTRRARDCFHQKNGIGLKPALLILLILGCTNAAARAFTPRDLVSLSRVAHPAASRDGRWLVWEQRESDSMTNRVSRDLWRLDLARPHARAEKIVLPGNAHGSEPEFGLDGRLYFLSDRRAGKLAVWRIEPDGTAPEQVTGDYEIDGFRLSPRGDAILVWAVRPVGARTLADVQQAPSSTSEGVRIYDQLPIRFWDEWADGERSQLFVIPLVRGRAEGSGHAIEGSLIGDVPAKPAGGREEVGWSSDGRTVFFALREAGRIEPLSTNYDIFSAPADGSAPPVDETRQNEAIDTQPIVSPNGRWLAWLASKRSGYENDRQVLMLREFATSRTRAVTADWDRSIDTLHWRSDSSALYVTAQDGFDHPLFRVEAASGRVTRLTGAGHVGDLTLLPSGEVIYTLDTLTAPADLWRLDKRGNFMRLTAVNAKRLASRPISAVTKRLSAIRECLPTCSHSRPFNSVAKPREGSL